MPMDFDRGVSPGREALPRYAVTPGKLYGRASGAIARSPNVVRQRPPITDLPQDGRPCPATR